ncbi:MAG: molybdopterin-binding protein [Burkholderiales bacterium]|nr:molybdopterin-binding protein [Burkholderiales bacterium]
MKFSAIIIGDEILSGKRQDKHLAKVIATLAERGLELSWAQYLGDDPELIAATLRRTFAGDDVVFCFGGIGATPDDHTRQSAARAAGVPLVLHPDAEAEIRGRFVGDPKGVTPQRLMMGEFPEGAVIIPNPYNRIPGFTFRHHHFLPGFPEMAWPMMEWALGTHYADARAERAVEAAIIVREAGESQLIELMNDCLRRYPALKVFSLPRVTPERYIELGVRGEARQVAEAIVWLQAGVSGLGFPWVPAPS